jgi:ABC-2 type transport system permease protein
MSPVNPVRRVTGRELLELLRDGRLLSAVLLVLVLVTTALTVGRQHQQAFEAERHAAQALDYNDWLNQPERHPHDAAHQGLHVFKPLPALAMLDPGVTPYLGSTLWLQAHRQSELRFRPAQDATGLQRFGQLSVAWVLQVLAPLLVIVLGFNMLTGEREQGTLRQTLAVGVTLRQVVAGKALALLGALGVVLLPVVVAALVALLASPTPADDALRLVLLTSIYGVYFVGVAAIVLGVSAAAASARVAITVLLGLWIVAVTLLPRAAADGAREAFPSPSRAEFASALDGELANAYQRAWLAQFGTTQRFGADVPLSRWGAALRVDDETGYEVMDRHFEALWQSFARQQRAQEWAGLVAPVLAVRATSMTLAGTDFAAHRHFAVAGEAHRRLMQDLISADLVEHADTRGAGHFDYQAGRELWERIPAFTYQAPAATDALSRAAVGVAVLLAHATLTLALLAAAVAYRARRIT